MAALAQPVPQEVLVAEAIKAVPAPKGLRFDRIRFDEDHTGDPAIRVIFKVMRRLPFTKARGNELADFVRSIQQKVDSLHTGRFTYVKFDDSE